MLDNSILAVHYRRPPVIAMARRRFVDANGLNAKRSTENSSLSPELTSPLPDAPSAVQLEDIGAHSLDGIQAVHRTPIERRVVINERPSD